MELRLVTDFQFVMARNPKEGERVLFIKALEGMEEVPARLLLDNTNTGHIVDGIDHRHGLRLAFPILRRGMVSSEKKELVFIEFDELGYPFALYDENDEPLVGKRITFRIQHNDVRHRYGMVPEGVAIHDLPRFGVTHRVA